MDDYDRYLWKLAIIHIISYVALVIVAVVSWLVWSGCKSISRYMETNDQSCLTEALVKWCVGAVIIISVIIPISLYYRYKKRVRKSVYYGRCRICQYPIEGLEGNRCPECGTPFNPHLTSKEPPRDTRD